ncbi:hypothetical protein AGLY_002535 [Aphis glycines]|uniref:Uncharacterized protein n=1 Tax=Aphis glycines TaxID=307491 RepID=A0A6G0U0N3_APHGL|nr:hypothetical protein AGLY_002535 [Aphis glycines]
MTKSDHKKKTEKTITVRQRDATLVPIVWQVSHMAGYALTAVISATCSIVFYLAVAKSTYRCYPYNEVLVVQEFSRERNQTLLKDERIWYRNMNCYDPFMFSLTVSIGSIVWMSLFLVFGRGGSLLSEESEHTKYFSEKFEKLYYTKTIILLWCQSALCTFNFLLVVYRCAMGVDFEVHILEDDDDDDDEEDDLMVAGPSNQTKTDATYPVILYGHIKLDYVSSQHGNIARNLKPEE